VRGKGGWVLRRGLGGGGHACCVSGESVNRRSFDCAPFGFFAQDDTFLDR
jgi:hypothetical protein